MLLLQNSVGRFGFYSCPDKVFVDRVPRRKYGKYRHPGIFTDEMDHETISKLFGVQRAREKDFRLDSFQVIASYVELQATE